MTVDGFQLTSPIRCANGVVKKGDIVQTRFEEAIGGDGQVYTGQVEAVYESGQCKVRYPDGEVWTGEDASLAFAIVF